MQPSLQALPKIELHLHLETSLRLRRLAESDHPERPAYDQPHLIADPGAFTGYDRLRRLRYAGRAGRIPDTLYTAENITRITGDLLAAAASQHTSYVEVRVGGRRGFSILGVRPMLEAMAHAAADAEHRLGIRSRILITVVRERGPEQAEQLVADAVRCLDCGVVGIDLAGDEANFPPMIFKDALTAARDAGLGITVHAGEFSGPASVWTAVYQLGAQRIGHGIRAVEDPDLLERLRNHHVTLEICPSSNLRLGLVASLADLPITRLMDAGVSVTVNSDDPLLLGTDLAREYERVCQACGLSVVVAREWARNAARAAFLPPDERSALERTVAEPVPTQVSPAH